MFLRTADDIIELYTISVQDGKAFITPHYDNIASINMNYQAVDSTVEAAIAAE